MAFLGRTLYGEVTTSGASGQIYQEQHEVSPFAQYAASIRTPLTTNEVDERAPATFVTGGGPRQRIVAGAFDGTR